MRKHRPTYGVPNNKTTWGAVSSFFGFVAIVLFLYFIFGGFESW